MSAAHSRLSQPATSAAMINILDNISFFEKKNFIFFARKIDHGEVARWLLPSPLPGAARNRYCLYCSLRMWTGVMLGMERVARANKRCA
jgi:hypothetical protein